MERGAAEDVWGGPIARSAQKNRYTTKQPPVYCEDRTLGGSRELFPEDFPLVGATTVVINQAVQGSSLGDKVSRLGLEVMQSIDLVSS